jgi:hypothetical protein
VFILFKKETVVFGPSSAYGRDLVNIYAFS